MAARTLDVGDLIGAVAGTLFVVLNAGLLGATGHLVVSVLAVAAAVVIVVAWARGRRGTGSAGGMPMTRSYRVIVTVEVVALVVGVAVLGRTAPQLTVPWVVLVVGAHFLAFARWWPVAPRVFAVLGAAMVVLAVAGGVVGIVGGMGSQPVAAFVAGFGSGLVMLVPTTIGAVRSLRA